MKFCIDCVDDLDRLALECTGLFVYDLRARDDWKGVGTIEPSVLVNNVGNIITNEPITFVDDWCVDFDEFIENNENVEVLDNLLKGE